MRNPMRYLGQAIAYVLFAVVVGYFSASPVYRYLDPDKALIKLNFSHAGQPKEECRRYTQEELDQLPPNMRRPMDCPRERVPLLVELEINGELHLKQSVPPSGIASDGAATVYEKFQVPSGTHTVSVRMRDSRREQGYDYAAEKVVNVESGQILVIDFEPETGGFKFL